MRLRLLILILLVCFGPLRVQASLVQPADGPYYSLRRGRTLYIYESGAREFADQLAAYHQSFRQMYDQSFNWKLDEEQDLILTGPNQQIANAFATTSPNIKSVWFPSGAGMLESMAESSWLLTLDAHETSHLYQLNAKSSVGQTLKPIFGNSIFIYPFVWPVFIQTNFILPTSFLEGNAVLNESRANMGGRLHSGEKRALVLAQIAAGDVDATRLINDEFKYPFGDSAYLDGGYFQAHLAAKYGVEKTNAFFRAQSEHYLMPLILNKTFREHFGESFYQEVHEFVHELEALAQHQQHTPGEPLVVTTFVGPMNQDDKSIWWMTTKGVELPLLHVFDRNTRRTTTTSLDLPMGKVFFDGITPLSASSEQHDLHHIEYSLYGEGDRFDPRFAGQIVTDQRKGKTVSLDARESWLDPHILLNGEVYDVGHSNPVLDDDGNIYYFRQNGSERMLYRNRQPVFKYEGYYGKVTEVGLGGEVFFIANTELGASLYRYSQGEITRMLMSDRVIDARRIREGEFLVTEAESRGHRILVAAADPKPATPAVYSYGFTSETVTPGAALSAAQTAADERSYNSWREMRYSNLDLTTYFSSNSGLATSVMANFNDPLEYQELNLGYAANGGSSKQALARYAFTKYLPQFYVQYDYQEHKWQRLDLGYSRALDQEVTAGILLPILRWRRLDAKVDFALDYQHNDSRRDPGVIDIPPKGRFDESYGSIERFELNYVVPTELGWYNWRDLDLGFVNRLDTIPGTWRKEHNSSQASLKYVHGLPRNLFITGYATYAWAENRDIDVDYFPYPLVNQIEVSRLTDHGDYQVRQAAAARLEGTMAINLPGYSPRIPIGLNRLAPLVVAQGIALDNDPLHRYPPNLFEWGWGADFEFLIFHKIPVRSRFLEAYDTRDPQYKETQLKLSFQHAF